MTVRELHHLTPEQADWRYLGVDVLELEPNDTVEVRSPGRESALVLTRGAIRVLAEGLEERLSRVNPFMVMGDLVYVPPDTAVTVFAETESEIAIGSAPATGRFPLRVIRPAVMTTEMRGGGPACRQITAPLAHPLPAEQLIVYEAYVPRGAWAGWPPHRHDGEDSSPYLEETYYFHFDRLSGYGLHRNYTHDGYDEHTIVTDGSLVPVPRGYHVSGAAPAANMWILNFLAGAPEQRALPPVYDPEETWIVSDWDAGRMTLPAVNAIEPPASELA
jgi:5-deoxy-glucuronate isomerase